MDLCMYGCGQESNFIVAKNKKCCSKSINSCEGMKLKQREIKKGKPNKSKPTFKQISCEWCEEIFGTPNIKIHSANCYMNPKNRIDCPNCGIAIKNYRTSKTCSHSCANTIFRTGEDNGNWNPDNYRTTCFAIHKKECVICGESNIVAVHHLDENKNNNDPANLIPMCPTHHSYWHSNYKHLVFDKVMNFVRTFLNTDNHMGIV